MPVRSFLPVAVGTVVALIVLLIISIECIRSGISGDGGGWAGLIFSLPFTYFLAYAVSRLPRRLAELRQWEQHNAELAESSSTSGEEATPRQTTDVLVLQRRRYWQLRWAFVVLLALSLLGLVTQWEDARWFWKVGAAACSLTFACSLARAWRQQRRDGRGAPSQTSRDR